jgi:hypothetical protein
VKKTSLPRLARLGSSTTDVCVFVAVGPRPVLCVRIRPPGLTALDAESAVVRMVVGGTGGVDEVARVVELAAGWEGGRRGFRRWGVVGRWGAKPAPMVEREICTFPPNRIGELPPLAGTDALAGPLDGLAAELARAVSIEVDVGFGTAAAVEISAKAARTWTAIFNRREKGFKITLTLRDSKIVGANGC